jgi:hypothetical protein
MSGTSGGEGGDDFLGEIVIRGVTLSGRTFRPSDWAERLAGIFSRMGHDHRMCYSPCVQPTSREGARCIVVNKALEIQDPRAYRFLLDFARDNELEVTEGRAQLRK